MSISLVGRMVFVRAINPWLPPTINGIPLSQRRRSTSPKNASRLFLALFIQNSVAPQFVIVLAGSLHLLAMAARRPTQGDFSTWSRRRGSNPRPAVYKTAALPTELHRQSGTYFLYTILSYRAARYQTCFAIYDYGQYSVSNRLPCPQYVRSRLHDAGGFPPDACVVRVRRA